MTIRSLLFALPLLLAGWVSVLIAVALVTDEAPAYVVLFPNAQLMQNLPAGSAVIAASQLSITVSSAEPGYAKALYASGARLVLPAGLPGCLPLPAGFRSATK